MSPASPAATSPAPPSKAPAPQAAASPPGERRRDRAFRELTAPVRATLTVATTLQALAAALAVVPFAAVYELADQLPRGDATTRVWTVVGVAGGAALLAFGLASAAVAASHRADADLVLLLRRRIARHLGRVPLGWFTQATTGTVQAALQDDLDGMHYAVAHARLDMAAAVVTPLVALVWLFTVSWQLTLITLVPLAAFMAFQKTIRARAGGGITEIVQAMRELHSAAAEFVQGIAVVKVYGRAGRAHRRFAEAADGYHRTFSGANGPVLRLVSLGTSAVAPVTVLAVVLIGGTALVAGGVIRPLAVLPFVLLGLGLAAPLQTIGQAANSLRGAEAAAGRVRALLAAPELPTARAPRAPAGGRVEFDHVTFAHTPGTPVLHDVDAVLEPGTLTALVGPSGAGKSTLAGLVARFFDTDSGTVRVGGADVREIAPEVLNRHVGLVLQDAPLLRTTIADNLRLARPEATAQELHAAARAAGIDAVIDALPRGYDSVVGEDARLSGGEAQRLAIARLFLADPPVLVLDEATAYADPDSEAVVQDALSRLAAGRTVLVITHRLSTVAAADLVLVLDRGRITERGRHQELLQRAGTYRRLWDAQHAAEPVGAGADAARGTEVSR